MAIKDSERRSRGTRAPARDLGKQQGSVVRRVSGVLKVARTSATKVASEVPGTIRATGARAHVTVAALQTLPDSTLRWVAASSVGLGAGFYLAGAPRLAIAAGVAPALITGAAIALRPIDRVVQARPNR
jgi:hypothetical protein